MNIRAIILVLLTTTTLGLTSKVSAQIPRLLTYQGQLTDSTGQPLPDGQYVITTKLYPDNSTTLPLYAEDHTVTVFKGLFAVLIGSNVSLPQSLTFDKPYYLGVSVNNGTDLSPRTPLTPTPYAIRSSSAATADIANGLSSNVTGIVKSLNTLTGDVVIETAGSAKISNIGNKIIISAPTLPNFLVTGVKNGDNSILVTTDLNAVASVSVAPNGITHDRIAPAAVENSNIKAGTITVDKLDITGVAKGLAPIADGSGNVTWQRPLQLPYAASGQNGSSPLLAITNSGSVGDVFRAIAGGSSGSSMTSAAIFGDAGTNYYGVVGFSDGGSSSYSGVYGLGVNSSTGVTAISNTGEGLRASSSTGRAGLFQITNPGSSATTLEANNAGTGEAIRGSAAADGTTAIHGIASGGNYSVGVFGETMSSATGTDVNSGASGILGKASNAIPGAWSAGVRGVNTSTNSNGIGVAGYQAGNGWGVYGETPSGIGVFGKTTAASGTTIGVMGSSASSTGTGVYGLATSTSGNTIGVTGETASPSGTGIKATYTGTGLGTPLVLDNGAIKVTGTNKAAFVHTITNANRLTNTSTEIDNPVCNGDPNCFVMITALVRDLNTVPNLKSQLGVYYDPVRAKWQILSLNAQNFPIGALFNVWVVKQ